MTLSSRITAAFALALLPFAVALAAPGNVTGITGTMENGKATVRWQKSVGETPVSYRVFYSRESILQNSGLYDDFEAVPGNITEYVFQALPYPTQNLYVSVLAVNSAGEESPLFVEETHINLSGVPAATSSAAMQQASSVPTPAQNAPGVMRMLSAKAVSATGVLLTFSENVEVNQTAAATAFTIRDASGSTLRVTRLLIQGKEITVHTVKQVRSRVYRLEASNAVSGRDAQGGALQLEQRDVLFMGHETGLSAPLPTQTASNASSVPAMGPWLPTGTEDVRNLQLRAQAHGSVYIVEVSWSAPSGAKEYRVSQSRDGGRTYSQSQIVAGSANGVKIAGIPGGSFGLLVQTVYTNGSVSRGAFQTLSLPIKGGVQGTVVPNPVGTGSGGSLPSSGIALGIPLLLSGAGVGLQMWRRKRQIGSVDA